MKFVIWTQASSVQAVMHRRSFLPLWSYDDRGVGSDKDDCVHPWRTARRTVAQVSKRKL